MFRQNCALAAGLLVCAVAVAQPDAADPAKAVRRDGWAVVTVELTDAAQFAALESLGAEFLGCEPRPGPNEFAVPPGAMEALGGSGIPFAVTAPDLQALIDAHNREIGEIRARERAAREGGGVAAGSWYDNFRNLAEIEEHLDGLIALRPDIAEKIVLGQSVEGRDIFGVRISGLAETGRCKPMLLLNSCQHAREWITPMVNMYNAERLITGYGSDPWLTGLVDRVDFAIVPVTNPDGYVYTWTAYTMWRKNRRANYDGTFGVDNNRNWGYKWGLSLPGGAGGNDNPKSDVYWGVGPFSEPENQALRDFALAHPRVRSHNDIHSTGQMILHPWGHTPDPCPDAPVFFDMGKEMSARIKGVHGASYKPGPIYTTIYPVSGSAVDWFYGDRGALSFTYELRGPGFQPPPSAIILGCEETFPATMHQAEFIAEQFQFKADWNADCVYDLFDFLAYANAFNAADPAADLDGDGSLGLFDYLEFVTLFNAGR